MSEVKLREKGQVTIPAELLQEWKKHNNVSVNDTVNVQLANGVLMLIPKKRNKEKRTVMSFAGVGKGLWGRSADEVDANIQTLRDSWTR
jgi:bifunctional DNA-binding transcriptional regulator/antitoxin component of YhaV-PrlF toxin-antitoxin module